MTSIGSSFLSGFASYRGSLATPSSSGGDVLSSLSESYARTQQSSPNAWTQITAPQKNTPGSSTSVPLAYQRALRRNVEEPAANASAETKAKPFDAGRISSNSGRIAVLGQLGAEDAQDSYKITVSTDGKLNLFAPNPDYNSTKTGSKISVGDAKIEVFDSKNKLVATTDTTNAEGFSNWVSLSTEGLGGLQVARGDYTVKVTRDKGVASSTPVNYTFYAVMGDPGATTFYTVKQAAQTAAQQNSNAAAAAKAAASSNSAGSILSLFS